MSARMRKFKYGRGPLLAVLLAGCTMPLDNKIPAAWTKGPLEPPASHGKLPSLGMLDVPEAQQRKIDPDTYLAAGRLHESLGQLSEAVEQYQSALRLRPDLVEALNRLGIVQGRLGKFGEAEKALTRAVELAPRQAHLWNNRAFNYLMQSRWPEAEADLRRALDIYPNFNRAHVNLGMVLAQEERFEEAQEHFQLALSAEDAQYNMGLMYQSRRRPAEAAAAFKQALRINPELTAARKRLDKLPSEVVSAAATDSAQQASPAPLKVPVERPTTPNVPPETTWPQANAIPSCLCLWIETTAPVEDDADPSVYLLYPEPEAEREPGADAYSLVFDDASPG